MSDEQMDKEDFDDLIAGLKDVCAYKAGRREGFVAHVPDAVNVRSIRAKTHQTQESFARTYGFSVAAVRDWEQGRRQPERAARILLAMIASEPDTVERVLRRI
jgi:putative transcriptional regulator